MKFSKRIIVAILVLISLFVAVMTVTYWIMGDVPEALITAVATMVTAEGGFLMLIKNADTKHKCKKCKDDESEDDDDDESDTAVDGDCNADYGDNYDISGAAPEGKNWGEEVQ